MGNTLSHRLLGTFGGENVPCCGFGFGDAVIVELLKECNKMPTLKHQVCQDGGLCAGHVLIEQVKHLHRLKE